MEYENNVWLNFTAMKHYSIICGMKIGNYVKEKENKSSIVDTDRNNRVNSGIHGDPFRIEYHSAGIDSSDVSERTEFRAEQL